MLLFEKCQVGVVIGGKSRQLLVFAGDFGAAFVEHELELLDAVVGVGELLGEAAVLLGLLHC